MSQTNPLISVIMSVFNGERYVIKALETILQQNYPRLEIIVIDDGSTDNTAALVKKFARLHDAPLHYVYQENHGQPAAHNHGLGLAQGEVITFLDADDLWPPNRFTAQLPRLIQPAESAGQAPDIILGRQQRFADGAIVNQEELERANNRPFHYSLGSSLFARRVFDKVGEFDESLQYTADWDWFVRAKALAIPTAIVPQVTLRVRVHAGNRTRQRDIGARFTIRMVKKHLDHHRASSDQEQ